MSVLTLDIEKAAAGGRMLARHDGRVVLVSGAIPGERVVCASRAQPSAAWRSLRSTEVLQASADRRADRR